MFDTIQILPLILLFFSSINNAWAGVNETIDNTDPSILYQPSYKWKTYDDSSCNGGSYALGHDSCANATIQCNWISFYYSSPLWPYPISTTIFIDGNTPVVVDLQDHGASVNPGGSSTVSSKVVYSYQGSSSQLHTVIISGSAQYPYSVVDSLIFETTDGTSCTGYRPCPSGYAYCPPADSTTTITITGTTTTTTTTTTSTSAPITLTTTLLSTTTAGSVTKTLTTTTTTTFTPSKNSDTSTIVIYYKHKNHGLTIGIAILAVCVGLLLLLLCFLLWRRYRHRPPPPKPVVPVYGGGGGGGSPHGSHTSLNRPHQPTYGAPGGGAGGAGYGVGGAAGGGGGGGGGGGYGAGSAA